MRIELIPTDEGPITAICIFTKEGEQIGFHRKFDRTTSIEEVTRVLTSDYNEIKDAVNVEDYISRNVNVIN